MLATKMLLILSLFLFVAVGCSSSSSMTGSETAVTMTLAPSMHAPASPTNLTSSLLTPTLTISPAIHAVATTLPSPTATRTLVPRPTATATLTPLPTLPPDEAEALIMDLLQNNAECALPCWWGFVPGETSWGEMQNVLATFASEITRSGPLNRSLYTVYFPVPEEVDPSTYLIYVFRVHDGIVEMIRVVFPLDFVDGYRLSQVLDTYGQPEEVWIRTFDRSRDMLLPFDLVLFYPHQGFMIRYRDNADLNGEIVRGCFQEIEYPPELWISTPRGQISFLESAASAISFGLDEEKEYRLLEEATTLDVETFFMHFSQPENRDCLETPASLWPPP